MELNTNNFISKSALYQELSLKKSQLAAIDKKEQEKSAFEKYDSVSIGDKNYDENDYQRVLDKFKNKDNEIKAHEQTHASSGAVTTGAINYSYQTGPDGKLYATGGSVRFDTSIPEDRQSALFKLEQLQNASSAPDELSSADAQIARTANLNKLLLEYSNQGDSYDN